MQAQHQQFGNQLNPASFQNTRPSLPGGAARPQIANRSPSPTNQNFLSVPGSPGGVPGPIPNRNVSTGYVVNNYPGSSRLVSGPPIGASIQGQPGIISAGSQIGAAGISRLGLPPQQIGGN
jgi:hypothetical protein